MTHSLRTVLVVGASTRAGESWLLARLPEAPRTRRGLLLVRIEGSELDAVLWAERLRAEARSDAVRLSAGVAELPEPADSSGRRAATAAAEVAQGRAAALGGDMTVAYSNLLELRAA